MKEVIFETSLKEIEDITKNNLYDRIIFKNNEYIIIKDNKIINTLKKLMFN